MIHLEAFVPGKLVNPLNGSLSRAHWTRRSDWSNVWHAKTLGAILMAKWPRLSEADRRRPKPNPLPRPDRRRMG